MSQKDGVTKLQKSRIKKKLLEKMCTLVYQLKTDVDRHTMTGGFDDPVMVKVAFESIGPHMKVFFAEMLARREVAGLDVAEQECPGHEYDSCKSKEYLPKVSCYGARCKGHCKHCFSMPDCLFCG